MQEVQIVQTFRISLYAGFADVIGGTAEAFASKYGFEHRKDQIGRSVRSAVSYFVENASDSQPVEIDMSKKYRAVRFLLRGHVSKTTEEVESFAHKMADVSAAMEIKKKPVHGKPSDEIELLLEYNMPFIV